MRGDLIRIRPATADDWATVRAMRLAMLRDSPTAFLETVERAQQRTERSWRRRAGRNPQRGVTVIAEDARGHWAGTAGALRRAGAVTVVAVFVRPEYRGERWGVLDGLMEHIEGWAAEHTDTLTLRVHPENARARRAYEKRGFEVAESARARPDAAARSGLELRKRIERSPRPR